MKFRTEYEALKAPFTLSPEKTVVLAGSCFSQNMANLMCEHKWRAVNPLGTLYNPVSIFLAVGMMLDKEGGAIKFEESLFLYNDIWHSNKFDSSFSSTDKEDCLADFKNKQSIFNSSLREGGTLIITFGTSICYYMKDDNYPVGNCHKQPSGLFLEKRLTITEITQLWIPFIKELTEKIPGIRIVFTVSPVRHLKNGFAGNSKSKAILLLAVEEICRHYPNCFYFPAYEILNDDLRDYRFYASDLVHPSEEAVEYIWEKFKQTFIDEKGLAYLHQGRKELKSQLHRPMTGALGKTIKK